jgi:hypothetical protein
MKTKITITGLSEDRSYMLELEDDFIYSVDIDKFVRKGQSAIENAINHDYERDYYNETREEYESQIEALKGNPELLTLWQQKLDELKPFNYMED